MKTFVTGARGLVGRPLVDSLIRDGREVRILVRVPAALPGLWQGRVEVAVGNLLDAGGLVSAVAGCGVVYHLAGEIRDPAAMWAVNKEGTELLVEASVRAGVRRFVHLSSVGVVGATGAAERVDEHTPLHPRNPYEQSKSAGEAAALRRHGMGGLQVQAIRPSTVYGEGRVGEGDGFLRLARAIQRGRFALFGGEGIGSYVYVGDVVAACRFVEQGPGGDGGCFIVNEGVALRLFVAVMARSLGVSPPPVVPGVAGRLAARLLRVTGRFGTLCNRTVFSMEKLERAGFTLPFGYEEGIRRTCEWYRSQGLLS